MKQQQSTTDITVRAERLESGTAFFARFAPAWQAVQAEVLKVETRQTYREPGNESWEAMEAGDEQKAFALLPHVRQIDVPLYASLRARGVEFVRCRPLAIPLSRYLRWELGCYEFNASHGEDIRFIAEEEYRQCCQNIHHDFMVFDERDAFIHDYDEEGEISGGWVVTDETDTAYLRSLFATMTARSVPYQAFLAREGISSSPIRTG